MLNSEPNRSALYKTFPGLANDADFQITGEADPNYNCIAWAGCENKTFWAPMDEKDRQPYRRLDGVVFNWPFGAVRDMKLETLHYIFSKKGYEICPDGNFEEGFRKVCFYSCKPGVVSHASRQLIGGAENGKWTSKLGSSFRITHGTPQTLESWVKNAKGDVVSYGSVIGYMRVKFNLGALVSKPANAPKKKKKKR